ncbi:hypothetical protein H0K13_003335 [Salmonella enterica]|uniref:hypothetical protein n=1 Tax=Salmonella enterica TaxID=28901 RepID=UPI000BE426CD|nr:hypothetical protein [Salmonella enterica]ATI91652.1 hypothetical protein CGA23_16895 [Salmonella enterica subsp. enterica]ECH8183577.1 hypothetical protein [Salmonella enterica subsp. enterica serovar Rissen]EEJ6873050.1 hypothetical protein [Salmonella enterica subsp. houtenae]EGF6410560.1 hypothetical protein [Salmonella enterica subsp. enterica serovar 6,8:d:-]EHF3503089.1 hypothetical protein [Salmonella enterica subsp. enterica serovar 6,8,20:d-]ELE3263977.1 hypothetical protein [Sal
MSNEGFNPEDIEDTLSRFGRGHKKSARPTTAGIPSFVPREPAIQNNVNTPRNEVGWAAAADHAEQQQAQELPPASPCFSQADIDEFLARKPKKYKMTERDYKELGRNIFLGAGDLIMSSAKISLYAAAHIPVSERQKDDDKILYYTTDSDGWGHAWTKNGKKY